MNEQQKNNEPEVDKSEIHEEELAKVAGGIIDHDPELKYPGGPT